MKRLDLVRYPKEHGSSVFVVLGMGNDGETDFALIAGIYNVVAEEHVNIPNQNVLVRDLEIVGDGDCQMCQDGVFHAHAL